MPSTLADITVTPLRFSPEREGARHRREPGIRSLARRGRAPAPGRRDAGPARRFRAEKNQLALSEPKAIGDIGL